MVQVSREVVVQVLRPLHHNRGARAHLGADLCVFQYLVHVDGLAGMGG